MLRRFPALSAALILVAASALGSCKTASYQYQPRPASQTEGPPDGLCRVYVARSAQLWGSIRSVEVFDLGQKVGAIGRDGFLCWDRKPGRNPMTVEYHGPKLDAGAAGDGIMEGLIEFDGVAGETYYWEIDLRNEDRKPVSRLLSAEEGRKLISERVAAEVRKPDPSEHIVRNAG